MHELVDMCKLSIQKLFIIHKIRSKNYIKNKENNTKFVVKVCPYGIIRTNRITLVAQRVERFVLILFPLKNGLQMGFAGGGDKTGLYLKDKF